MSQSVRVVAREAAQAIRVAFDNFERQFQAVTLEARVHFEARDWQAGQRSSLRRLELYKEAVTGLVAQLRELLDDRLEDRGVWKRIKESYAPLISCRLDYEIAETFFNSATRRVFATVGVDPRIEFVVPHTLKDHSPPPDIARNFQATDRVLLFREILTAYGFRAAFADLEGDCARLAEQLKDVPIDRVDMLDSVFFRNKGAYLVGRIHSGARLTPLVLALENPPGGIVVDALLTDEDDVSMVFSFTRSYFHVKVNCPSELAAYLKTILPLKPVAELYICLGYNKHGKTELFRNFIKHLKRSDDLFEIARGERGMVMSVFTLPSYDVVFKVIKDRFAYPKTTTRRQVMEKYRLVFKHDRVGRLVDAQEFEHVTLYKRRFSGELLEELGGVAARTVGITPKTVVLHHLYTERRITPLDLYIREAPQKEVEHAVLDYGATIKQLAAADIFPGDMFLKNFGVTRHGRVVFYDYDELCFVTDCSFRHLPPQDDDDDLADEPHFYVGPNDVFPEEFRRFLGLSGDLRALFERHHGDLFTVEFWTGCQEAIRAGELPEFYPYPADRRLRA